MFHTDCRIELRPGTHPGNSAELFRADLARQAALVVLSPLTYPGMGRPMIRASPHSVQAHSRQSPSGTSGQLAGSE